VTRLTGWHLNDRRKPGGPEVPRHRHLISGLAFLPILILLLGSGATLRAQSLGNITTFAGTCSSTGYSGDNGAATSAKLGNALGNLAADPAGNVFIADTQNNVIRRVDTTGIIKTVAGTGAAGNPVEGVLATSSPLRSPGGVAVNPATNVVYVADSQNAVVRGFTVGGNINTVIGGGATNPDSTPRAPLTLKLSNNLAGMAFDGPNNLLYFTNNNNSLLKWDLAANTVVVVVGSLGAPSGVAVSASGVPYIAEAGGSHVLSKFQSGVYSVVAGGGNTAIPTNGSTISLSTSKFSQPGDVAFDSFGYLYVTDNHANQMYRIDLTTGLPNSQTIGAVAGTGANGCTGENVTPLSALLQGADGITINASNRVYVGGDTVGVIRTMPILGPPASVTVVSGSGQSAIVGASFASPFVVVVKDSAGNPLPNISVTFAGGGETVSPGTATTGSNGQAQTTVTASTTTGTYTVKASVTGVSTPASGTFTNLAGTVTTVTFTTQPSNATAGATITPAVQVRAADTYGNFASGVTINLTLQGGTGTLSGTVSAVTNSSGLATFSNLSVNKTGTYTLKATDPNTTRTGTSASFVISPAAAASISVVAGNNQSAALGTVYSSPLKAQVQDSLGNAIPNVSVTFTAPSSGASVTFSGPSVVNTDSTGIASVTVTANNQIGSFTVNATTPGAASPAAFNLSNIAGSASGLAFVQQPSNAVAGASITPAVTVQVKDSLGNNVPQAGISVTLSPVLVSGRPPSASGTTATTNATGLATFSSLSFTTAGQYQVSATATSLTSATSSAFVISPGVPAVLSANAGSGQSATIYGPFATALQALVTDSHGNPVSGVVVSFTAPASGASATLSAPSATTSVPLLKFLD
jgi:adhesin/invasin